MISLVTALPKLGHLEAEARTPVSHYVLSGSRYSLELQCLGDGCRDPGLLGDAGADSRVRQGRRAGRSPRSAKPPVWADGVFLWVLGGMSVGGRAGTASGWHMPRETQLPVSTAALNHGQWWCVNMKGDVTWQSAWRRMIEQRCDASPPSSTKRTNLICLRVRAPLSLLFNFHALNTEFWRQRCCTCFPPPLRPSTDADTQWPWSF